MKKRKFPFLKCCEWLDQSALSAGILFLLYGFFQSELAKINAFFQTNAFLGSIIVGIFIIQLLLVCSCEKGYLLHVGLSLLVLNITVGLFFMWQVENSTFFLWYVGLEAVCIVSASVVYMIQQFHVLKGLLILLQAALLIVLAVLEKPLPAICVCVMLIACLLYLVELVVPTAQKRKEVLGLFPVFTVAIFLLCFLPRSEKPLDWSWLEDTYTAVQEKMEMKILEFAYLLEGENEFSFSYTGYGNNGKLGGFLFDKDQEQLHVVGSGTKNPLYLTGTVYDVYTGEEWQSLSQESEEDDFLMESDALQYALYNSIYEDRKEDFTSFCHLAIEYRYIKTTDLFHELYATNVYNNISFSEKDNLWKLKKAQGKDFTYQMKFLEVNENSEEIKALLRQQAWKEDAVWDRDSLRREAEIYKTYTQLPDDIPKRVYELAHTLAANADNDYDRMVAFADYLRNYTYTTTPPACPDNRDFIDYFLFDSKSGYCTYFATAMAVLGRCEGIPTRYVKGFLTTDTCKNSNIDVMITGKQAHAWMEVYIEHVGWVRFDATPGYGENQEDRWGNEELTNIHQTENPYSYMPVPQEETVQEPVRQDKSARWNVLVLLKMIALILVGCVLSIALIWIRNALRRKKYIDADMQEKIRKQIKRLLRLGKLRGQSMADGETLQAYQARIHEMLDTREYLFARACNVYEGMRFGGKTVSPAELQRLETYVEKVEQCYLAGCGFLRKLIYRIM